MKKILIGFFVLMLLLTLCSFVISQPVFEGSDDIYYTTSKTSWKTDCSVLELLEERVKCRYTTRHLDEGVTELCEKAPDKPHCTKVMDQVDLMRCNIKRASQKGSCFRTAAGIVDPSSVTDKQKRQYVAALLFSLVHRTNEAADNELVSGPEAIRVITSLEEAAQKVLAADKTEILRFVDYAQQDYKEVVS